MDLVSFPHGTSEGWACYHDDAGLLRKLPVDWTSLAEVDVFREVAKGRSAFRPTDLVALSRMVRELSACADEEK